MYIPPGVLPFLIIAVAIIVLVVFYVFSRLSAEVIAEIALSVGTIWLIVIAVLLFVSLACASIQVSEGFSDISLNDVVALEKQVCALMTSSDSYILNDVGQPGQDNPAILAAAQTTARGTAPLPVCALDPTELESRVSRMENALKNFTGPQLKKTYDKTVPCTEGFMPVVKGSLSDRMQAIKATIADQQTKYEMPIQKKTADVKAGILSTCEKNKAAAAAVPGS
jgi:hypothetical protein